MQNRKRSMVRLRILHRLKVLDTKQGFLILTTESGQCFCLAALYENTMRLLIYVSFSSLCSLVICFLASLFFKSFFSFSPLFSLSSVFAFPLLSSFFLFFLIFLFVLFFLFCQIVTISSFTLFTPFLCLCYFPLFPFFPLFNFCLVFLCFRFSLIFPPSLSFRRIHSSQKK